MRVLSIICLIVFSLFSSACVAKQFAIRSNDSNAESVVFESKEQPGQVYVIVKGKQSLKDTLERLKCRARPCVVGRLGEIYVVDQPER
jgi:hypothetical protein